MRVMFYVMINDHKRGIFDQNGLPRGRVLNSDDPDGVTLVKTAYEPMNNM